MDFLREFLLDVDAEKNKKETQSAQLYTRFHSFSDSLVQIVSRRSRVYDGLKSLGVQPFQPGGPNNAAAHGGSSSSSSKKAGEKLTAREEKRKRELDGLQAVRLQAAIENRMKELAPALKCVTPDGVAMQIDEPLPIANDTPAAKAAPKPKAAPRGGKQQKPEKQKEKVVRQKAATATTAATTVSAAAASNSNSVHGDAATDVNYHDQASPTPTAFSDAFQHQQAAPRDYLQELNLHSVPDFNAMGMPMGMGGGMYNTGGGGAGCILGGGLGTVNMNSNGLLMNFSPQEQQVEVQPMAMNFGLQSQPPIKITSNFNEQHIHNLMQFHQSQSQNMMMGGNHMMQMQSVEQDIFEEFQLDEEAQDELNPQEGYDEKLFLGSGGGDQHQEDAGENLGLWAGDEMNVNDDDHDWTREIDVDGQGAGQGKGSEHYHDFSGEFLEGAEDDGGEQHQDVEMENFFDEEQENHNFNYGGEVDEVPDAREAPEPAGAEDELPSAPAEDDDEDADFYYAAEENQEQGEDDEGMQNAADVQQIQMQMMYNAQQLQQMYYPHPLYGYSPHQLQFMDFNFQQVPGASYFQAQQQPHNEQYLEFDEDEVDHGGHLRHGQGGAAGQFMPHDDMLDGAPDHSSEGQMMQNGYNNQYDYDYSGAEDEEEEQHFENDGQERREQFEKNVNENSNDAAAAYNYQDDVAVGGVPGQMDRK